MLSLIADVLFRILLGPAPLPPTQAALDAHDEAEDARAIYGQYPGPWDVYEWEVEWREEMLWLGLLFTARWKIAGIALGTKVSKRTGATIPRQPLGRLNPFRGRDAQARAFEARRATAHIVRRTMRTAVAR